MPTPFTARSILADPIHCPAFGFGAGLSPVAPGTCGTLVGIPFFLALKDLPFLFYLFVVAMLFGAGVYLCGESAKRLGVHDHGGIVWDEIVGYLVTLAPVVMHLPGIDKSALWLWAWMAAGFALFRVFDIAKPQPVHWADRKVHGGLGIMLDDLIAGVYAALSLTILMKYFGTALA